MTRLRYGYFFLGLAFVVGGVTRATVFFMLGDLGGTLVYALLSGLGVLILGRTCDIAYQQGRSEVATALQERLATAREHDDVRGGVASPSQSR